jgi:subtilisin-like proprotein convertase family protein
VGELKMPTNKIYKKVIEVGDELNRMGLNGWETEFVISDRKKKEQVEVKVIFKLKRRRKNENKI